MTKRTKDGGSATGGADDAAPTFEERLKALEDVVSKLERDDVPLEDAIRLYEQGMALHAACEKTLAEAQVRIERLTGDHDAARPGGAGRAETP